MAKDDVWSEQTVKLQGPTTEVWSLPCILVFTRASDGEGGLGCRLLEERDPPNWRTNPGDEQNLETWTSRTLVDNSRTGTREQWLTAISRVLELSAETHI